MLRKITFVILSLSLEFVLSGCGLAFLGSRTHIAPITIDLSGIKFVTDDESLRSWMMGSWISCKATGSSSVLYQVKVSNDQKINVWAHTFADSSCKSDQYESYELGEFGTQDFTTKSEFVGTAQLQLKLLYPHTKNFEEGITRIGDSFIYSAESIFTLSANKNSLHVHLANYKLEKNGEPQTQVLDMDLIRGKNPTMMISGVEIHNDVGIETEIPTETTAKAKQLIYSKAERVVGRACLDHYFAGKPDVLETSEFRSVFINVQNHTNLIRSGYEIDSIKFWEIEDVFHKPFFSVNLIYWNAKTQNETDSTIICENKLRPAGVIRTQN